VSFQLRPGPPATPDHLRAAQERERILRSELPRVRTAAAAWRTGLAGLLAALAGFGLIKGQSDITQLTPPWAAAVGVLLLAAAFAGAAGALLLIRAANGRASVVPAQAITSRAGADHQEALSAAAALRRGIALTLICAALLAAAVGATWYGPPRNQPALRVITPDGTECGTLIQFSGTSITISTVTGQVSLILTKPSTIEPVTACPSP
jgi:hypothetical protein